MASPSRSQGAGTYFATSATWNRRRLFHVETNAALLLDTLQKYRRDGHYRLHAFVVMPDHFHLLLTTETAAIERVMGLIKGGFSHSIESKMPVWRRGFTDHRIRDANDYALDIAQRSQAQRSWVEGHGFSRAINASGMRRLEPLGYGFFFIKVNLKRKGKRTPAAKADPLLRLWRHGCTRALPRSERLTMSLPYIERALAAAGLSILSLVESHNYEDKIGSERLICPPDLKRVFLGLSLRGKETVPQTPVSE